MGAFKHGADFESAGTRIDAWLFEPSRGDDPPVVVMGHGFAGEKSWRLPALGRAFADEGVAALVFDYRGFGDSEGDPRNVVAPKRHVEDYLAAVEHAREMDRTGDRIAVWGWSLSGGHALTVAAREDVDAVVAGVPFLDGRRTVLRLVRAGGFGYARKATTAAMRDLLRKATLRSPHYVPVAGYPDEFAVLNRPGALEGFRDLVPDGEEFTNECAARIALTSFLYRPISGVEDVTAPALVVEAEHDQIVPSGPIDTLVERLDDVERVRYDATHFDLLVGDQFEAVADRQAAFLRRHLHAD